MGRLSQWFYNSMYRFTKPDWDIGVTPPEVTTALDAFKQPGRALDLGCGTGTSAVDLAQQGWQVTAVDFSPASKFLLFGFKRPAFFGRYHLAPEEVRALFQPTFAINSVHPALNRDREDVVWYDLTRI